MTPTYSTLLAVLLVASQVFVPERHRPRETSWAPEEEVKDGIVPIRDPKAVLRSGGQGAPDDWDIVRRIHPDRVGGSADIAVCCLVWALQLGVAGHQELYRRAFMTFRIGGRLVASFLPLRSISGSHLLFQAPGGISRLHTEFSRPQGLKQTEKPKNRSSPYVLAFCLSVLIPTNIPTGCGEASTSRSNPLVSSSVAVRGPIQARTRCCDI